MGNIAKLLLVLTLLFTVACSSENKEQKITNEMDNKGAETIAPEYDNSLYGEEGIKNAIRGYNYAIISINMKLGRLLMIKKYATREQEHRVISFAMESRTNDAVMRSKLSRLYFNNISSASDTATVWTEEKWYYDYIDFEGKLVQPVKEMDYQLKYGLIRLEDGWKVSSIDELRPPYVKNLDPPRALFD